MPSSHGGSRGFKSRTAHHPESKNSNHLDRMTLEEAHKQRVFLSQNSKEQVEKGFQKDISNSNIETGGLMTF